MRDNEVDPPPPPLPTPTPAPSNDPRNGQDANGRGGAPVMMDRLTVTAPKSVTKEKASPALISELKKSPRGREMLTRLRKGEAAVLFGNTSQLTANGIERTMGRYLSNAVMQHLGLTGTFGMVIDADYINSQGAPTTYTNGNAEAFYIFVMDNEFKAFDLSTDKNYSSANDSTKQKMELASQAKDPTSNVTQKLRNDSVRTANDPSGTYSRSQAVKLREIRIPPNSRLIDFSE
jgi:hypothetical protein